MTKPHCYSLRKPQSSLRALLSTVTLSQNSHTSSAVFL